MDTFHILVFLQSMNVTLIRVRTEHARMELDCFLVPVLQDGKD